MKDELKEQFPFTVFNEQRYPESSDFEVVSFSVFEKWLSEEEFQDEVTSYSQAVENKELATYLVREQAFKDLYENIFDCFSDQLEVFRTVCTDETGEVKDYILYENLNKETYMGLMIDNVREQPEFSYVWLKKDKVLFYPCFDLTHMIWFGKGQNVDFLKEKIRDSRLNILSS